MTEQQLPPLESVITNFDNLPLIDTGQDSIVRAISNYAVKKYLNLDAETIELYQEITNKAKAAIDGNYHTQSDKIINCIINPILAVAEHPQTLDAYSISPIVQGINLNQDPQLNLEFSQLLHDISIKAIQATEYKGINIIPYNAKLIEAENTLIITDLCQRIGELTPLKAAGQNPSKSLVS